MYANAPPAIKRSDEKINTTIRTGLKVTLVYPLQKSYNVRRIYDHHETGLQLLKTTFVR